MDKIRDSADILQPEKKETYQFIEKLLSSVKENFSTNRVHLGMDEAVMLGLGNYLKENGYKKGSLIIREHCNRVVDICRKLELKPIEYYGAAEPPVRCGESHLSGLTEPPHFVY